MPMPLVFAPHRFPIVAIAFQLVAGAVIPEAWAATRRVPSEYATIQAAIDASTTGDEILVSAGTYLENLDTRGKTFVLRGESGPSMTTIDGNRTGRVITIGGGGIVTVEGFTITGGESGGGLSDWYEGSGIRIDGSTSATIRDNLIRNNLQGGDGFGAGMYIGVGEGTVLVEHNTFRDNISAFRGGGIADISQSAVVRYNTFVGNAAQNGEGAAFVTGLFTHNVVVGNFGGAIAGAGTVTYNTIVDNQGYGIHQARLAEHNIIVGNSGVGLEGTCLEPLMVARCNDVWNNAGGDILLEPGCGIADESNFSSDPQFCAPLSGDYHLSAGSPCAEANNAQCGDIGAFEVACGSTASSRHTWGSVKIRYR